MYIFGDKGLLFYLSALNYLWEGRLILLLEIRLIDNPFLGVTDFGENKFLVLWYLLMPK